MAKLSGCRCFSVMMAMALVLGVGIMAVMPNHALADEGTWDIQTLDDIDVISTSLALDSNGYPHISYTTSGVASLHYAYWTGTAWVKETVDDVPATATSLALDSQDHPHISYSTLDLTSLHYAHWTGTSWVKETVDDVPVIATSIALDSNDYPHISYATFEAIPGSLHYARWTGTEWAKETIDSADVSDCSIALDSNDRPHISYFVGSGGLFDDGGDHSFTGMLKYAYWTGSAWSIQTVDEETVTVSVAFDRASVAVGFFGVGNWSSIALDSYDLPHISYGSFSPSISIVTSLHYARLIPLPTATVNTATGTGTATFSTSAGGIAELTAVAEDAITCAPQDVEFPQGLFSFSILDLDQGATVTVTITFPSNIPAGTQYWKCQNGTWVDVTSLLGDNDGDNVLTLTITDGGLGDLDGVANGEISDPGGPALERVAPIKPGVSPTLQRPLNPPQVTLQYLSITPRQTSAGQPVTVTTNVVNTGDEASNLNVTLKINGQLEQSRMVGVGPQTTQPVKFTVTKSQPGTYNVDVLGKTGEFTILGAGGAGGATGSKTGLLIVLALIGVLIVASVVVLLVRRS